MTTRISQPDTPSDVELRAYLDSESRVSFNMVAGAGSGKTTSLIKALDYIGKKYGSEMSRKKQKVVCITYTEIAQNEIWNDVGQNSLYHVSTIHSFLWMIIKPFQNDIKKWVTERLNEKIQEAQERIAKPRTRAATIEKLNKEISEYQDVLVNISEVSRFTYGTGSNYGRGILGHDDILKMVPSLIENRTLLRSLIIDRYPYIFIDESQDTAEVVVNAMRSIELQGRGKFCLGFFGDPMQKIYANGIGEIPLGEGWVKIEKTENFRCSPPVLSVINKIRSKGDGLTQVSGKPDIVGSARIFIAPADEHRGERMDSIREWIAETNKDPLWSSGNKESDMKILVTLHRVAASRLGFSDLYSAFNDNQPPASLREGFTDGTSWALTPLLSYILPLYELAIAKKDFEVVSFLRKNSPLLLTDNIKENSTPEILANLNAAVSKLIELIQSGTSSIIDVLLHVKNTQIFLFEDRVNEYLSAFESGLLANADGLNDFMVETAPAMIAFFNCPASQLISYKNYIENDSPFATQQGIKGAEFSRVFAVLDDEEGAHIMFSYNKYFGITAPSNTDIENEQAGKETVIDRTRRLFYVVCSRATKDLVVVLFSNNPEEARKYVSQCGIFPEEDIHIWMS